MSAWMLAIDDRTLPLRKNLCLHLSRPTVRREPVLAPSPRASGAPDNLAAMFYGSVLRDGGRYRMWYHACHRGMNPDWPPDLHRQFARYRDSVLLGPPCYAESDDGIAWKRVPLRQVLFKGTTENNALALPHGLTAGVCVIRDDDDPMPARRYKMVYQFFPRFSDPPLEGQGRMSTIATAISPDGLHWTFVGVPFPDQFVEHSAFYRHQGKYIVAYQAGDAWGSHFSEGGAPSGRQGLVRYSLDFDTWVDGYVNGLILPEPANPAERGAKGNYVQNHIGVGAASFGNVCVGLYGLWHNKPAFEDIWCDLGLAVSEDGLHFREPAPGHVFLAAEDSSAEPAATRAYRTNLCQANGILNVGEETRIYHGRWRNTGTAHLDDYYGSVALATLPRDRWGALALFPNREEGWVWSAPVALAGQRILLNAEGGEGLTVELADERCAPIPAFSGANAGRVVGREGFDLTVQWPSGVAQIPSGLRARVRVILRRCAEVEPRLYAVKA